MLLEGGRGEVATPATENRVVIFACFTHFCLCSRTKWTHHKRVIFTGTKTSASINKKTSMCLKIIGKLVVIKLHCTVFLHILCFLFLLLPVNISGGCFVPQIPLSAFFPPAKPTPSLPLQCTYIQWKFIEFRNM